MTDKLKFLRVSAFIIDLALSFFLMYFLLGNASVTSRIYSFFNISSSTLLIKSTYLLFAIFFLLSFYSSLIFARTIGQLICGIKIIGHGPLQVRLAASLRVVTLPIRLILDYFEKERAESKWSINLSGSKIKSKDGLVFYLTSSLTIVTLLGLSPFAPLLYKNQLMAENKVEFTLKSYKDPLIESFDQYQRIGAKALNFASFTNFANNRFKIQPSYEIRKTKGRTIYRPLITIWDEKTKIKGMFKINKRFNLYSLVKLVRENYFFFDLYYPELDRVLELSVKDDKEIYYLNKRASLELFELITNSLLTNRKFLSKLLVKGHFQFLPYITFKLKLMELLGVTDENYVDFIKSGDVIFIRKKDYSADNIVYRETFFALNQLKPIIYSAVWDKHLDNDQVHEDFATSFFYKALWGKKVDDQYESWLNDMSYNPLTAFDIVAYVGQGRDYLAGFEKFIVKYYRDQGVVALRSKNEEHINVVYSSLQRFFVVWQLAMKRQDRFYSKATVKKLNDIMLALKTRDRSALRVIK